MSFSFCRLHIIYIISAKNPRRTYHLQESRVWSLDRSLARICWKSQNLIKQNLRLNKLECQTEETANTQWSSPSIQYYVSTKYSQM